MNYRALYDDDPKSGNDAADLAYLQGLINRTQKSPDQARVSERTVFKIFGPTEGETVVTAFESSTAIPARVKGWFKPSEGGIDITDPSTLAVLGIMVTQSEITQQQSDSLQAYGFIETVKYIDLELADLLEARRRYA